MSEEETLAPCSVPLDVGVGQWLSVHLLSYAGNSEALHLNVKLQKTVKGSNFSWGTNERVTQMHPHSIRGQKIALLDVLLWEHEGKLTRALGFGEQI